ncbi:ankyrin repeat domain-containing protein [Achromobacter sp. MY14]|uniref:ankyrin repeat domain-containing protein n=1 Tax=unclassified Achromobacter TaxID=2626865 RepID=UPI001E3BE930|nr:ankyrin repeat domain-containing protein [Achromobacter sp. MY14]MCD0496750.1 ankyrin repeat domain-containing protein [Achromobacter sp. MY14]
MIETKTIHQLFLDACDKEDLDVVKTMLLNGINPLCKDEDDWNGLTYAASKGNLELFKTIENAAIENTSLTTYQIQRFCFSAMDYAIKEDKENIVNYVLGKATDDEKSETCLLNDALYQAAAYGRHEMAKSIIDKGANIHDQDNSYLILAAEYGHKDFVHYLIELGAEVSERDDQALINASKGGHTEIVDMLLKHGANIHSREDDALYWASNNGHAETVELLLENGADINTQNRGSVLWAARNGRNDVIDVFVKRGIDIFDQDECPINEAIYNRRLSVAQNIIVNHNLKVPESSIMMLNETKEAAIQMGQNASVVDDIFKLIEKQNLHNKLRNNLAHKNTQPIAKAGKTKDKKMKI